MNDQFNCTGAIYATGRRKAASAKVWLKPGTGRILIRRGKNYLSPDDAFPSQMMRMQIFAPFKAIDNVAFDVLCAAHGGGISGQADAIRQGISRALDEHNTELYRPLLKQCNLLTRDSRRVQPKNAGYTKSRRGHQRSKR